MGTWRDRGVVAAARGLLVAALVLQAGSGVRAQSVINVPGDHSTIQVAINAAQSGDTVLVAAGTYFENIDFNGMTITLTSQDGADVTTIDGGAAGSVVLFNTGEPSSAVLQGFTITNGMFPKGAGVRIEGASPTIRENRIVFNSAIPGQSGWGSGMSVEGSTSLIEDNEIAFNTTPQGDGGGLGVGPGANVMLIRNVIHHNTALGNGGGVYLNNATAVMLNLTIADNISTAFNGGGIDSFDTTLTATNVVLWGNQAPQGQGPQIHLSGGGSATVTYSDVQGGFPGTGNINDDPLFSVPAAGDYSLVWPSPCIDAGDPSSPLDPDGTIADIGAIPFKGPWQDLGESLAGSGLPSLAGTGSQTAGSLTTLALSNALPFAFSTLVVDVTNISAPFKGGVMVPNPNLLFGMTIGFLGEASLAGLWPPGIPSGFTTYFQWWVVDAGGPQGFAASNAVSGTTP